MDCLPSPQMCILMEDGDHRTMLRRHYAACSYNLEISDLVVTDSLNVNCTVRRYSSTSSNRKWETGERTYEPLDNIAVDDLVTSAIFAKRKVYSMNQDGDDSNTLPQDRASSSKLCIRPNSIRTIVHQGVLILRSSYQRVKLHD